ncbi:hypothetical protein PG623_08320 [Riemerella anatipestifer]|nr:hypothetical protein [Riemerella anatipestifer]
MVASPSSLRERIFFEKVIIIKVYYLYIIQFGSHGAFNAINAFLRIRRHFTG